jgi:decaprenylphospho-beta-D-erythro-pentofuranosid-2-ulose 2-reductase
VNKGTRVIIYGATSTIAAEVAKLYAAADGKLFLVGRDPERLEVIRKDLEVRGGTATSRVADLERWEEHEGIFSEALSALGGVDLVVVAHGTLPDQRACEQDFKLFREEFERNFLSAASLLHIAARYLEERRDGVIVAISSVAGDRGRQSNYVYGSAKGALTTFLQGLRNRLYPSGVRVVTIKPGFVNTKMTAALPKNRLYAEPDTIARGIVRAVDGGHDVVYLPWFWIGIMTVIRSIPECIFKRLKL